MFFLKLSLNNFIFTKNTSHQESDGRKMFFLNLSLNNFFLTKIQQNLFLAKKSRRCETFEPISLFLIALISALKKIISRTIICLSEKEKRKN
jgi:hypothetical protein